MAAVDCDFASLDDALRSVGESVGGTDEEKDQERAALMMAYVPHHARSASSVAGGGRREGGGRVNRERLARQGTEEDEARRTQASGRGRTNKAKNNMFG